MHADREAASMIALHVHIRREEELVEVVVAAVAEEEEEELLTWKKLS